MIRKLFRSGNLTGVEFHIPTGDIQGIGKVSAILGENFNFETNDVTATVGAKLSGLGFTGDTSISLKFSIKASTTGNNPTVQGRDFANNFKDSESRERFNKVWTDPF